jgi:hypothetical protein
MGGFRSGGSTAFDRNGVPQWMRSVFQGHTALKALQHGRDGHGDNQLPSYSRSLGCSVLDNIKMAMFLATAPSCTPEDRHWGFICPDAELVKYIRRNLPTCINMDGADAEFMHVDLASKIHADAAGAPLGSFLGNFSSADGAYTANFQRGPVGPAPPVPQSLVDVRAAAPPAVAAAPPAVAAAPPATDIMDMIQEALAQRQPAPAQTINIQAGAHVTFNGHG